MKHKAKKRGSAQWILAPKKLKCACGTVAQHATNARSKRRVVFEHAAPDGSPCPHYEQQEAMRRTNAALSAAGLPIEWMPSAPLRFD